MGIATHAARILKNLQREKFVHSCLNSTRFRCVWHARLQQKSQPRNARREIFVVTRAERTPTFILCRMWHARKARQIAAKRPKTKTTVNSICYLAEDAVRCETGLSLQFWEMQGDSDEMQG